VGGGCDFIFFLIIFLFLLCPQIKVSVVFLLAAAEGPPAPLNSAQRSTSAQACSWDYRSNRNKSTKTGEQQLKLWISLSAQGVVEQNGAWLTLACLSRRCLSGCSGKNLQSEVLMNYFKVAVLFILQR